MKEKLKKISIILFWLALWQIAAVWVDNDILLAGPAAVGKTLMGLLVTADFYRICLASVCRILWGFCLAFLTGAALGALSYRFPSVREISEPMLSVMKSIPVASFVVLLLIWQGAENLSVWISFFVVFPNACVSTRSGLEAVEPGLKEMAEVFDIRGFRKAVYIYRPCLMRFLLSGMEISIGMAFKSGVAAEVIGVPDLSIGERIYVSKIYLDTPGLFAWTFSLILLSYLVEKLLLQVMRLLARPAGEMHMQMHKRQNRKQPKHKRQNRKWRKQKQNRKSEEIQPASGYISVSHVSKSFGEKKVLCDVNARLTRGECYLLMAPSGSGKTTLMRIMSGLEQADEGQIKVEPGEERESIGKLPVSYLFQEDRLLENEFTITNIMLTTKEPRDLAGKLQEILPEACLKQPVSALSGGMKRRCALARAMFYRMDDPDTVCLLDEPFAGLDDATRERTAAFIRKYLNGRTLIVATHDEQDADLLGGTIWRIA